MSNEPRYPDLEEKELPEQVSELKDYIVNLHRYIRYANNHIDKSNLTRRLADEINTFVDDDGVIHILDEIDFNERVDFTDYVTFTNLADPDDETVIDAGHIKTGTIDASVLNLSSYAKFSDLANENNYTIIHGGNILTGTIDADQLSANAVIIGGVNLLANSKKDAGQSHSTYNVCDFDFTEQLKEGQKYTLTAKVNVSADKKAVRFFHSGGTTAFSPAWLPVSEDGTYTVTFTATAAMAEKTGGAYGFGFCRCYVSNNTSGGNTPLTGTANVEWIQIERGNRASDWSSSAKDIGIAGTTIISGGNITTGTIDAETVTVTNIDAAEIKSGKIDTARLNVAQITAGLATTAALEDYSLKTQSGKSVIICYKSAQSGTNTMAKPDAKVTDVSGDQRTWTTKRPQYDSNSPVLFLCWQTETVSGDCGWTTPVKDDTTTVIDGGHITTGTIDASVVTVTNINASEIKSGTIDAARLDLSEYLTVSDAGDTYATQAAAGSDTQYIYRSVAINAAAPGAYETWVTNATGNQNVWTNVRPEYSSSYPVLYVAQQKKTVSGTVTCTQPAIDKTTTVIDGGNIITNTIRAESLSIGANDFGSENLLKNSSFSSNLDGWTMGGTAASGNTRISINASRNCLRIDGAIGEIRKLTQSIFDKIKFDTAGEQVYTLSADIRVTNYVAGTTNPYAALYISGHYDNGGTSTWMEIVRISGTLPNNGSNLPAFNAKGWQRVNLVFKFSEHTPTDMSFYFYIRDCTGYFYFRNVKLERGYVATDWTPAPDDIGIAGTTVIHGGNITTNTITADKLNVTDLRAIGATIGGFTIGQSSIYNGMSSLTSGNNGIYLGTNGMALGGGKFKVTSAGKLSALNCEFTAATGLDEYENSNFKMAFDSSGDLIFSTTNEHNTKTDRLHLFGGTGNAWGLDFYRDNSNVAGTVMYDAIHDNNDKPAICLGVASTATSGSALHLYNNASSGYVAVTSNGYISINAVGNLNIDAATYTVSLPEKFRSAIGAQPTIDRNNSTRTSSLSVQSASVTEVTSVTLSSGRWFVIGNVRMAGANGKYYKACISTSTSYNNNNSDTAVGVGTNVVMMNPWVYLALSGSTTVRVLVYHNAGSALNCEYAKIQAFKIADY